MNERWRDVLLSAYISAGVGQLADVLFVVLVFGRLTPETAGAISWILAVTAFFGLALDLGATPVLMRDFSARTLSIRGAYNALLWPRWTAVLIAVGYATFVLNRRGSITEVAVGLTVAALGQFFRSTGNVNISFLRASGKQIVANWCSATPAVARCLGGFVATAETSRPVLTLFAIVATVDIVTYLAAKSAAKHRETGMVVADDSAEASLRKRVLVVSAISGLAVTQNRMDWLLVNRLAGSVALATYSLANRVYETVVALLGLVINALYPALCESTQESSAGIKHQFTKLMSGALFSAAFGAAFAAPALRIVWSGRYAASGPLVRALMCLVPAAVLVGVSYNILMASGRPAQTVVPSAIATVLQLTGNIICIPLIGARGAALGMWALVMTTVLMYCIRLRSSIHLTRYVPLPLQLLAIAMAALAVPALFWTN